MDQTGGVHCNCHFAALRGGAPTKVTLRNHPTRFLLDQSTWGQTPFGCGSKTCTKMGHLGKWKDQRKSHTHFSFPTDFPHRSVARNPPRPAWPAPRRRVPEPLRRVRHLRPRRVRRAQQLRQRLHAWHGEATEGQRSSDAPTVHGSGWAGLSWLWLSKPANGIPFW